MAPVSLGETLSLREAFLLREAAMLAKTRALVDVEDDVRWAQLISAMNHERDIATVERLVAKGDLRFDDGEESPRLVWVSP